MMSRAAPRMMNKRAAPMRRSAAPVDDSSSDDEGEMIMAKGAPKMAMAPQ